MPGDDRFAACIWPTLSRAESLNGQLARVALHFTYIRSCLPYIHLSCSADLATERGNEEATTLRRPPMYTDIPSLSIHTHQLRNLGQRSDTLDFNICAERKLFCSNASWSHCQLPSEKLILSEYLWGLTCDSALRLPNIESRFHSSSQSPPYR
jgi:hypothetical protein